MNFVVAIDGPAASGKGTITREIANQLGLTVLPTGDIYRCLALEVLRKGYGMDHIYEIVELAKQLNIQFKNEGDKEVGALRKADDAILIDTTEMSIEEAVAQIRNEIEAKRRENNKETTGKNYNSKEHLTNASSFDEYDSFDM